MNNKPFLLKPAAKDYLWGGSRLNDDFKFGMDADPFAEAWVCSTHRDGCSVLTTGETLREVLKAHPEYIGTHASTVSGGHFPILIKLIDQCFTQSDGISFTNHDIACTDIQHLIIIP